MKTRMLRNIEVSEVGMGCMAFSHPPIQTDKPSLIVNNVRAGAGNTVDVTVSIQNNPGIAGALLKLSYDSGLTLTNAVVGDAFSDLTYTKPGRFSSPCNFSWDSESGMTTTDGIVLIRIQAHMLSVKD